MFNTERSLILDSNKHLYRSILSTYLPLIYGETTLVLPYLLNTNRDLCVFNMLACLTFVSLLFSVISIPMFNFLNYFYTSL